MILTLDVETSGLDATGEKFLYACIVDEKHNNKVFKTKHQTWNYLLTKAYELNKNKKTLTIYAHNMMYDFWNIYDRNEKNMTWYSFNPFIAEFKHKTFGKITFLDTLAIYRMSLKEVGKMIEHNKLETPIELIENGTDIRKADVINYMINDTIIVMKSIQKIRKKLKEDNINIKRLFTINQIAMQYLLKRLADRNSKLFYNKDRQQIIFPKYAKFIHQAYRGGRVEAFKTGDFKNVYAADFNSLYPYAATQVIIPNLKTEQLIHAPLNVYPLNTILQQEGVSKCIIHNKSNNLGLLPIRTADYSHYPKSNSILIGTWTHTELRLAIKEGYEILDIEKSVTYKENIDNDIAPIMEDLYIKRTTEQNIFNKYFYKAIMNSSIAKFGQRRKKQEYFLDTIEKAQQYIEKGYNPVKAFDYNYLYKKEEDTKQKKYYSPIIPTLINAKARCIMYELYKKIPKQDLLYTDTDSIIAKTDINNFIPLGNNFGQMKQEHRNVNINIYGRKTYKIGSYIKASGLHKNDIKPEDFDIGCISTKKITGFATAQTINDIGKFKPTLHDLRKQRERYNITYEKIQHNKFCVDSDLTDISYFMEHIKKLVL